MALLRFSAIASIDGYIEDRSRAFDMSKPYEEVHACVNEQERGVGTYLYGRRMWETMRWWGTDQATTDQPPVVQEDAGIWRDADKVVSSSTLPEVDEPRTQLALGFEPETVRRMKAAADRDLS